MRRRVPRGLWVGLSIAGHAGVLAILATAQPQLRQVESPPVFEVTVAPRFLTTAEDRPVPRETAANRPLRPRRALRPDETSEVAPLITRNAPASTLRGDTVAPSVAPESGPTAEASPDLLRNALRRGAVGCANPTLLSKAEREACLEKLGAGAKDAPFIEPPMSREKRAAFDEAAAKKQAYRRYKGQNIPPGRVGSGLGDDSGALIIPLR